MVPFFFFFFFVYLTFLLEHRDNANFYPYFLASHSFASTRRKTIARFQRTISPERNDRNAVRFHSLSMTKQLLFRNFFFSFLLFVPFSFFGTIEQRVIAMPSTFELTEATTVPLTLNLYGTAKLVLAVKSREKRKVGKSSTLHRTRVLTRRKCATIVFAWTETSRLLRDDVHFFFSFFGR